MFGSETALGIYGNDTLSRERCTVRGYFTAIVLSVACLGVTVQGQRQVFPGGGQAPLSAAVKADGLIYVSGALMAKGDINQQTYGVLDSLGSTLKTAGS